MMNAASAPRTPSQVRIIGYGCSTSAGPTTLDFWNHLCEGQRIQSGLWPHSTLSIKDQIIKNLCLSWKQIHIELGARVGVIFASTKGCIEDYIWNPTPPLPSQNPYTEILSGWIKQVGIVPKLSLCMSNACSSALVALNLGSQWVQQDRVDQVIVLTSDKIGRFASRGFESLHALTPTYPKPFSAERDGLALGDAAAVIVLGKTAGFRLKGIGIDTEGFAVTRPSPSGASLKRAYERMTSLTDGVVFQPPSLIIAHGTGTPLNDATEDQTFESLFPQQRIPITATKWCNGHTLGASGALDLIAACESLLHQRVFSIATTKSADPQFQGHYLVNEAPLPANNLESVLISSLGFGGIHAVAEVAR